MGNGDDNKAHGSKWWVPIAVAIISAFGGAFGGNLVWRNFVPPEQQRADAFTGTQGASLEKRVLQIERRLEGQSQNLNTHLITHPDRDLSERLTETEANDRSMQRQINENRRDIERLEDKL